MTICLWLSILLKKSCIKCILCFSLIFPAPDLQLSNITWDALREGMKVLVAAADHCLQASTLARALWAWQAAGILLACPMGHRVVSKYKELKRGEKMKTDRAQDSSTMCSVKGVTPWHLDIYIYVCLLQQLHIPISVNLRWDFFVPVPNTHLSYKLQYKKPCETLLFVSIFVSVQNSFCSFRLMYSDTSLK